MKNNTSEVAYELINGNLSFILFPPIIDNIFLLLFNKISIFSISFLIKCP